MMTMAKAIATKKETQKSTQFITRLPHKAIRRPRNRPNES